MAVKPLPAILFLTRQDGSMIPLVAVDELPYRVVITSVPRLITSFDLAGMTCVGSLEFRHGLHTFDQSYIAPVSQDGQLDIGEPLKAKFFGTRNTGALVPLVAMDEMPESFVLEGVPRVASTMQIAGMTCIGTYDSRDRFHTFTDVNQALMPTQMAPTTPRQSPPTTSQMRTLSVVSSSRAPLPPTSNVEAFSTMPSKPSTPAPVERAATKRGGKEYCSYWLRNGECDYMQQGCMYKHEMPLDIKTLRSLGLRDIPRWYRHQEGLGSYLAARGAGASFNGSDMKSAAVAGDKAKEKKPKFMQNWRNAGGRGRSKLRTKSDKDNEKFTPPEKMSSVHYPLEFTKSTSRYANCIKMPADKASQERQLMETHARLDIIEEREAQAELTRASEHANTSTEEGEASGLSSNETAQAVITPESSSSPTMTPEIPEGPASPAMTSVTSDIEADIHREDLVRRERQSRHYEDMMGNMARQSALDKAGAGKKEAVDKKVNESDECLASSSHSPGPDQGRESRDRGKGKGRGRGTGKARRYRPGKNW